LVALIETPGVHRRKGPVPSELEALCITNYRQMSQAPFRIVYSIKQISDLETVIVHIVADARRDFMTLLAERLPGA